MVYENIKYGEHEQQVLDVHIPDCESFPVLVYFHGGGIENGNQKCEFVDDLVKRGIAVVSATYRKYPNVKYPQFIEDGATVVKWTKNNIGKYGKSTKFIVGGTSAGAYITMMLCFNKEFLNNVGEELSDIDAWYHNTGQITTHFNVLKERGIDTKRVVIDEAAPIYYINGEGELPIMEFAVTTNDMPLRHEQHELLMATFKNYGYDMSKVSYIVQEGSYHGSYVFEKGENGNYIFADMLYDFICKIEKGE